MAGRHGANPNPNPSPDPLHGLDPSFIGSGRAFDDAGGALLPAVYGPGGPEEEGPHAVFDDIAPGVQGVDRSGNLLFYPNGDPYLVYSGVSQEDHGFGGTGFRPGSYQLVDDNEDPIRVRRTFGEGMQNAWDRFVTSEGRGGVPASRRAAIIGGLAAGAATALDPKSFLTFGEGNPLRSILTYVEGGTSSPVEHIMTYGESTIAPVALVLAGTALAIDAIRHPRQGVHMFAFEGVKGGWNSMTRNRVARGVGRAAMAPVRLVRRMLP